nr:Patched domain containing protein [Haemonchus contortus]
MSNPNRPCQPTDPTLRCLFLFQDELELYTPTDAQARVEVRELDSLFHINDSDPFYATRRYDIKRAGYIIITHRDEDEDVLNPLVMHAAMQLWSIVQSLTVEDKDDRRINYPGICVKFPIPPEFVRTLHKFFSPNMTTPDQICVSNPLVEMFKLLLVSDRSFVNQSIDEMTLGQITEAIHLDAGSIIHLLGGVTLDSEKRIAGAKAMMLPYALRHSARGEDWLAEQWELRLADFLLHYDSPVIRANWWTYETLAAESARDRNQLIRLAVGGVISAAMAIASAIGLLLLLGFAVGVDNVFILLSAWRSSPTHLSLQKRMEETFADAGVSITVTSLTDFISFAVGCATPFPSVQMFCAYAVTAVLFTYVYQLTFFAGIMVYTNRREMDNRNCLTFMKIKKDYGSTLHVWMYNLSEVDIGPRRIWTVLDKEIELYEYTEFTGAADSWLRTYLAFTKQSGLLITQDNFVYILRNVFLSQPQFGKYRRDVVFDASGSVLDASRVPIQLRHVGCANQSRAMHLFRRLAETSQLPTGVYADFFQFAEQYNAVLPGTLSSIGYAGVAVVVVSLLLIPEPVASLWVSFSIVSINVGILGFMTFWSVRLDFISMVTIVMSIGFCVDFAAHLAYNFAKGRNLPPSERMRNALYAVGAPILQSATSTILGVSFLASAESYVFRSFLKTIFLVIVLGVLHGLVILPVLLTMFHCSWTNDVISDAKDPPPSTSQKETPSSSPPANMNVKYLASPDLYKFPTAELPLPYVEYLKDLCRPPAYHEASAPYPMRARLKYPKNREHLPDRGPEYSYFGTKAQPR